MTRQKLPDICDFCAKEIDSETQYTLEAFQGKSTFGDIRIKDFNKLDCCHKCWLEICTNGHKPKLVKEQKNPGWVPGSKKANEKYYVPVIEPEIKQEKITA